MYDHHVKAGNPGDVIKHVALIAAANVLMQECEGVFYYADTYAGYAYNPLKSEGEWRNGVGVIHTNDFAFSNHDILFWRELWDCCYGLEGSLYPGSSVFMRKLCMRNRIVFRPRLWDVSPAVISQLMTSYRAEEATVYPRPATMNDFRSDTTNLLLIDPPDFNDVDKALCFFDLVENVILWLPTTTAVGSETESSIQAIQKCREKGLKIISASWDGSMNTRGCRLVYHLPDDAEYALVKAVSEVTKFAGWICQ